MKITINDRPARLADALRGLIAALMFAAAPAALCDPLAAPLQFARLTLDESANHQIVTDWSLGLSEPAYMAGAAGLTPAAAILTPQGNEMSAVAAVQLDHTERHFRAQVVDWFDNRSHAAGLMSDLLIHGSDTGLYLMVEPGSAYELKWQTRF